MRITVCETPHAPGDVDRFWGTLRAHCHEHGTDLLVLPELAFLPPVWEREHFDARTWARLEEASAAWLARLPELGSTFVVGAMPATVDTHRLNRGVFWSAATGIVGLRAKRYLPDDPGGREARWFAKGTLDFPAYSAGPLKFGLNICTELWALDTLGPYAKAGVHAVITPRATAESTFERWLALARTAAVRAGAFSLSSNRRHEDGSCGGAGWIIDPEGIELARTSTATPIVTRDIALSDAAAAKARYPRDVLTADGVPLGP